MNKIEKNTRYATAVTIGCRLNQTDTAIIFAELKKGGFEIEKSDTDKPLSLIVVNTCSVTTSASQKSRQYTRALREKHPDAKIIVTGCDIEVDRERWLKETDVDLIIPNKDKSNILSYIANLVAPASCQENKSDDKVDENFSLNTVGYFPFKSRANLKIQDGCDAYCTYCIVPYGRGKPRSRKWSNTLAEFEELLSRGYKEIILTGVNIATYNDEGKNLIDLVNEMCHFNGEYRIRLGSTEPQFSMQGLIELIASNSKICRFLHLPLQHGSNKILKKMGRNYDRAFFSDFIHEAKEKIPDICIGTDAITGFPGETEHDYNDSFDFISSLPISYLHVFKYSIRQGTAAASYLEQVEPKISEARHKRLTGLGIDLSRKFLEHQEGKEASIIVESNNKNILSGWTDNYIKATITETKEDKCNSPVLGNFAKIKLLTHLKHREMKAELLY